MTLKMSTVTRNAAAVLDELTAELNVGESRKMDRGPGYMPVHVECLQRTGLGLLYSVAHYFEQNGDLVPDPDVVFVRAANGWSPVSFQNSMTYRVAVTFHEDGTIETNGKEQAALVRFCNQWFQNIREQQGLSAERSR